ncbi:MAG: septum formation initiator family protein [Clostridia bacterium]|nr:septum formation initiator family protein [Clostridia bacterium]
MRKKSNKAKPSKKSRKKRNWILYIAVVAFSLYIVVTIVNQQIQISNAKTELEELNNKISIQKIKNDELKQVADAVDSDDLDSFSDYIEKVAREDLDYVKNGEVVFINIAGD